MTAALGLKDSGREGIHSCSSDQQIATSLYSLVVAPPPLTRNKYKSDGGRKHGRFHPLSVRLLLAQVLDWLNTLRIFNPIDTKHHAHWVLYRGGGSGSWADPGRHGGSDYSV